MSGIPPLISIVVPAFNEAPCLEKLHLELRRVLDPLPYRFELLFVDDGSSDGTVGVLTRLRQGDARVCFISLSRNFGHQAALSAGLDHARGDAVIMMDGDLQHPPQVIPALIDRWRAGFDVVNTVRKHTEAISPGKRLFSAAFYWAFNKIANIRIEPGAADFRLMSRPALAALNSLPEKHRFLRGLIPWLGFRQTSLDFVAPERWAGASKYTFRRNLRFALDGMTAFNLYPLRRLAAFGWLLTLGSTAYALAAVMAHLLTGQVLPGWSWVLVTVLFFGGWQMVLAGILGEYLGRVVEQVKDRPIYLIRSSAGLTSSQVDLPFDEFTPSGSRDAA